MLEERVLQPDVGGLKRASEILRGGQLLGVPTETVYGLAARCDQEEAVQKIYQAKGRPAFNPLIIHCHSLEQVKRYAVLNPLEEKLFNFFAPGPLTLVLAQKVDHQKSDGDGKVAPAVMAGLDTIAVRLPCHPVMQELLKLVDIPLAAPSANKSEHISPTCARHVLEEFSDISVLDGGSSRAGLESTILRVVAEDIYVLRPGGVTFGDIERAVGVRPKPTLIKEIQAPGQMKRHYAPKIPLRLNATHMRDGEALLSFGVHGLKGAALEKNLSLKGDLEEAAQNLYAYMRALDQLEFSGIAVMPIPTTGVGAAINDRLMRAAAEK